MIRHKELTDRFYDTREDLEEAERLTIPDPLGRINPIDSIKEKTNEQNK